MADYSKAPADAPPSYQQATGSSSSSSRPVATSSTSASRLDVPGKGGSNGMSAQARRSMEDESRPLPQGWVRTFDPTSHHQFFVDTTKDPPRSIWIHPYDDEQYLSTLTGEERERIEHESLNRGHPPSKHDIMAAHTDDEDDTTSASSSKIPNELPPRPDGKGKKSFGRKFKDKVTGSTHEEREQQRAKRAEEERQMYEYHTRVRQAMATAQQTGQPQLIGKDRDGKDIYVEPPNYGGYGGGYGGGGYGYDPYSSGVYSTPNARYIRPSDPYRRPYGGGYGGGYGLPLALGGGLLGGMLIGDMMGGGMGMGMGMGGMGMGGMGM